MLCVEVGLPAVLCVLYGEADCCLRLLLGDVQLGVALGAVLAAGFWAAEPIIPHIFSSDAR